MKITLYVHIPFFMCAHSHTPDTRGGQKTTCVSQLLPSTTWDPAQVVRLSSKYP